jgi:hypothetical protein
MTATAQTAAVQTTVQPGDKITILTKDGADHAMAVVEHTDGSFFTAKCPLAADTMEILRTSPAGRGWMVNEVAKLRRCGYEIEH